MASISTEGGPAHFGLFASADIPTSSAQTQARLGWTPTGAGLLDEIENAGYLDA